MIYKTLKAVHPTGGIFLICDLGYYFLYDFIVCVFWFAFVRDMYDNDFFYFRKFKLRKDYM